MTTRELAELYVSFYKFYLVGQHNVYLQGALPHVKNNLRIALRGLLAAGYTRYQIKALQRAVVLEVIR